MDRCFLKLASEFVFSSILALLPVKGKFSLPKPPNELITSLTIIIYPVSEVIVVVSSFFLIQLSPPLKVINYLEDLMVKKINEGKHRLKWTLLLIAVLLATLFPVSRRLVFENPIIVGVDSKATEYVDASLIRASAAFLLARSLNGIISVFQESEIQLEPGGVGVSVALGQALDPINDLIERFSWVMLASLTSLGIQKILIQVGAWFSISIVLSLGLLFLLADLWIGDSVPVNFRRVGGTLVLLSVLIRFAVPAMAFLNNQVYETILKNEYEESSSIIGDSAEKLKKINAPDISASQQEYPIEDQENSNSWLSKAGSIVKNSIKAIDFKGKYESIKNISTGIVDHIVKLIVVFLINTILLPLLFLYGFLKLARIFIRTDFGQKYQPFVLENIQETKIGRAHV